MLEGVLHVLPEDINMNETSASGFTKMRKLIRLWKNLEEGKIGDSFRSSCYASMVFSTTSAINLMLINIESPSCCPTSVLQICLHANWKFCYHIYQIKIQLNMFPKLTHRKLIISSQYHQLSRTYLYFNTRYPDGGPI